MTHKNKKVVKCIGIANRLRVANPRRIAANLSISAILAIGRQNIGLGRQNIGLGRQNIVEIGKLSDFYRQNDKLRYFVGIGQLTDFYRQNDKLRYFVGIAELGVYTVFWRLGEFDYLLSNSHTSQILPIILFLTSIFKLFAYFT